VVVSIQGQLPLLEPMVGTANAVHFWREFPQ